MIRKARLEDREKIAQLILMASSLVFEDILKTTDYDKINEFVMSLYDNSIENKFSMDNIIVYTVDNEVAGCLVYYFHSDEDKLNENMNMIIDGNYQFKIESIPNTIYLDSIAVFDDYQGKGIARKLIEHMINNFDNEISLLVETYKENVQSFYERLGFNVVGKVELFNGELNLMNCKHKHK